MKNFPLNLDDLVPREVTFALSDAPNKQITLGRWSLRVRAWATEKSTPEGLKEIFEKQKIEEIADMAFFMLKDKTQFQNKDAFMEAIVTIRDQITVIKSLLATVGIGEPEIEKLTKAAEAGLSAEQMIGQKKESVDPKTRTKRPIGAKPSTR